MHCLKVFLATFLLATGAASGQSVKDVFTAKTMTWYGLDFSRARFIGPFNMSGSVNPQDSRQIRDVFMDAWNEIIVNEPRKYKLGEFYRKEKVLTNLSPVQAANDKIDTNAMFAQNAPEALTADQIQATLKNYGPAADDGVGLVFVVESFDKLKDVGTMHVTFFDTRSNQVLLTKRLQTKPGGFGLRNYWVRTAYEAMDESSRNWKKWGAEAGVRTK